MWVVVMRLRGDNAIVRVGRKASKGKYLYFVNLSLSSSTFPLDFNRPIIKIVSRIISITSSQIVNSISSSIYCA